MTMIPAPGTNAYPAEGYRAGCLRFLTRPGGCAAGSQPVPGCWPHQASAARSVQAALRGQPVHCLRAAVWALHLTTYLGLWLPPARNWKTHHQSYVSSATCR